ncbi:AAA family ATPase [Luteimonas sp. 3794]|uniref:AAA family ATPase n=1 Tax=Luteimonas sp. 3794 TaxID=2817730 RepID=UPI00286D678F|nr:AAA family ATPase [Luteimonas sp. 3794]
MVSAASLDARAERAALLERSCDPRDEVMAGAYGAAPRALSESVGGRTQGPSISEALRDQLVPWSEEELLAALQPWPHAFREGNTGLFPSGEVSILAAAGREGKTTVKIGIAVAMVTGHSLAGGLLPESDRSVVVYSAEDDRQQYARKVAAQIACLGEREGACVRERLLVPNLDDAGLVAAKTLVMVLDGQPLPTGTVDAIIEALEPLTNAPAPLGLLIFETASTLSDAEESNPGFRVLVLALKRIARELKVPVVLSHHVSQASLANLADLNVSTTDIRGGTALVNNARQTGLLVNLGSEDDPFPENDARTVLRQMAAPGRPEKVTALISLDSSKGITPPPIFFRWVSTEWGPAAVELDAPRELAERSWRKVHEMVRARRSEQKGQAKEEKAEATTAERVRRVVEAVQALEARGTDEPVTLRRIRELASMSSDVANKAIDRAVEERLIKSAAATVRGKAATVYALTDSGESRQ